MCHYVIKFYECDHKTDDNVRGCFRWRETGTHCDIENRSVRNRDDCSIRSESVTGLCPKCQSNARARIEQEEEEALYRRDLEKARLLDQEEQRRSAKAHEAHLRRIKQESMSSFEAKFRSQVSKAMQESAVQASRDFAAQEEELMRMAIEASQREFMQDMETRFGDSIEDGSSRLEAIKRKSTMDWHHKKWGPGAHQFNDDMGELEMKMSSSFSIKETQHRSESHRQRNTSSNRGHSHFSSQSAFAQSSQNLSMSSAIPPSPPLPSKSTSTALANDPSASGRSVESTVSSSSTTIPPPAATSTRSNASLPFGDNMLAQRAATLRSIVNNPLSSSEQSQRSQSSQFKLDTDVLCQRRAALESTSTLRPPSPSPPPSNSLAPAPLLATPPPPPPLPPQSRPIPSSGPALPPVDYSQPPKDQKYGHLFLGTRRQPIHHSQEHIVDSPTSSPSTTAPRGPLPTVRLAGTIAPRSPSSTSSAASFGGMIVGEHRNRLRPVPRSAPQEQAPNELEALWSRRGIQRERDDEDDDGITVASISPSESASQIPTREASVVGSLQGGEDAEGLRAKRLGDLGRGRRTGWGAE
ncbi:hypothetical protein N0V90_002379 [Kalmusia sp. IMI 367209]|nr:hypothetical protein N0V90_002379 [Kalmusia sp. IMI 367209]